MKRILHLFLGACLAVSSNIASADSMSEIFDDIMTTNTAPQAYESNRYQGFVGGSFSMRYPNQQKNFANIRLPSASAGCNGISLDMGSFSIVEDLGGELQNVMRQIAAGAASYAFNIAVDALCPTCMANMQKLKDFLDETNRFMKDACAITEGLLNNPDIDPLGKLRADDSRAQAKAMEMGWIDDAAEFMKETRGKSQKKIREDAGLPLTDVKFNIIYEMFFQAEIDVKDFMFSNLTFSSGGMNRKVTYPELVQAILGSVIFDQVEPEDGEQTNSGDSAGSGVVKEIPSLFRLSHIVRGLDSTGILPIYPCNDLSGDSNKSSAGACTSVGDRVEVKISDSGDSKVNTGVSGLEYNVFKLLDNRYQDSIARSIRSKTALSAEADRLFRSVSPAVRHFIELAHKNRHSINNKAVARLITIDMVIQFGYEVEENLRSIAKHPSATGNPTVKRAVNADLKSIRRQIDELLVLKVEAKNHIETEMAILFEREGAMDIFGGI
ncbi:conjugal transfer protein TraH [Enterovibrio norvegicus]|uniref:conjugal transfer protein TraH n=1 Tax=Enterovibrio norvegicus TaxID=188144 RepID=UPI00352DAD03